MTTRSELPRAPGAPLAARGRRPQYKRVRGRRASCRKRGQPFAEPGSAGRERKAARGVRVRRHSDDEPWPLRRAAAQLSRTEEDEDEAEAEPEPPAAEVEAAPPPEPIEAEAAPEAEAEEEEP